MQDSRVEGPGRMEPIARSHIARGEICWSWFEEVATMAMREQIETDEEPQRYEEAKKRAVAQQGFFSHLVVYTVVNLMIFLINALTRGTNGAWWFYWPLLGWGVGLAIHAATFFIPVFSPDWAEQRARKMIERDRR